MEYQTVVNMNIPVPQSSLSRTSSANSFSSEDDASMTSSTASTIIPGARRTRKRFTNAQLTMLENLFHINSHPSREDREAVAKAGGMEIKSVTIWFQNKRQTERKSAANNAANASSNSNSSSRPSSANGGNYSSNVVPNITSTLHTFSLHNNAGLARNHSMSGSANSSATSSNSSSRPTLDRVASRTELRSSALNPRTPSRRHNPSLPAWENMPSSPLASPPYSPPSRDLTELNKNAKIRRTLTLEWACEAARIEHKEKDRGRSRDHVHHSSSRGPRERSHSTYGKEHRRSSSQSRVSSHERTRTESAPTAPSLLRTVSRAATLPNIMSSMAPPAPSSISSSSSSRGHMDITDDEEEEAVTPPSTWGKGDSRWDQPTGNSRSMLPPKPKGPVSTSSSRTTVAGLDEDDEMVKAALALCGLGKRGT